MSHFINAAEALALIGAGLLFLIGLLTGVWKYLQIRRSPTATAHPYVDIAHRAALMYSFASLLLAKFAEISQLPEMIEVLAVAAPLTFFFLAVGGYVLHGALRDTDNQLRRPHVFGRGTLPNLALSGFMLALIVAEIGGFLVLFYGLVDALLQRA